MGHFFAGAGIKNQGYRKRTSADFVSPFLFLFLIVSCPFSCFFLVLIYVPVPSQSIPPPTTDKIAQVLIK